MSSQNGREDRHPDDEHYCSFRLFKRLEKRILSTLWTSKWTLWQVTSVKLDLSTMKTLLRLTRLNAAQKSKLTASLFATVCLFAVFTVAVPGLLPCPAIDDSQRLVALEQKRKRTVIVSESKKKEVLVMMNNKKKLIVVAEEQDT
ncbi:hypothetical protein G9A89_004570 [Geosiphon pyriformis]|nr:hypothetical protein G9A89_004570 [Geosiphon pyriformis]